MCYFTPAPVLLLGAIGLSAAIGWLHYEMRSSGSRGICMSKGRKGRQG